LWSWKRRKRRRRKGRSAFAARRRFEKLWQGRWIGSLGGKGGGAAAGQTQRGGLRPLAVVEAAGERKCVSWYVCSSLLLAAVVV